MEHKILPTAKESALYGVTQEIKFFVKLFGAGFHPDTDFADYVDPSCSKELARRLNGRLQECFDLCEKYELDIYEIVLSEIKPLLNA